MEEKCGTTQVEEDVPLEELESSSELIGDLCGGGFANNSSNICMPICFLVREQAKSLIAIKNLQKRLHQIEGIQGDVVSAISDVHDYLTVGPDSGSQRASVSPRSCASSKSALFSEKSPYLDVLPNGSSTSPLRTRLASPVSGKTWNLPSKPKNVVADLHEQVLGSKLGGIVRGKDAAPESDKQDSGLDSDCREQGQESNPSQNDAHALYGVIPVTSKHSDELLDLLDEIGEKSEMLRQHVSGVDESPNHLSGEVTKLQLEQLGLKSLLCNIKEERDDLKSKLVNLEHSTCELAVEKKELEQRFLSTLVEKHKLETKIQAIKPFSVRGSSGSGAFRDSRNGSEANLSSAEKRLVYKVDSEAVSSVLKETSTIDLQKQVLTYMMENEVLRTKIDQIGQVLAAKDMERECLEKVFRDEARQLVQENEQLRLGYDDQKMEIATLMSRVRMLEKLLQSTTAENQELHMQLAETLYFRSRAQKGKFANLSSESSCSYPVRRLSLPAKHTNEPDISVSCAKAKLLSNTSSFIDVTIEDKSGTELNFDPSTLCHRKASTPLNPSKKHEKPNFSDFPSSFGFPADSHPACPGGERRPNKRLTFNSMKTLAASSNTSRELCRSRAPGHTTSCDKTWRKGTDPIRPLESIQEKNQDVKTFPFFTILQKLKASSDHNLSEDGGEQASDEQCPMKAESPTGVSPSRKSCNVPSEPSPEETNQSKDKRGGAKNIHKRIQNILDRITAESDAATAVPSSMI